MSATDRASGPNVERVVGRYRLSRLLGTGGMGSVYEAVHVSLGLRVAIKTLKPSLADNTITSTRFEREGVIAAKVRHPNAVSVYDVLEERGAAFLVMEYLEGETMKELLDRDARLTPEQAADLLLPVLSAVATAHDEGVVHRDLKPSNIFLARERTGLVVPKVLDFGLSWAADDDSQRVDITRSGVVLGTLQYMAPEQVRSARKASAASDQYALGVILYQSVTGQRPYLRETQFDTMNAIVSGQHPPLRAVAPELPEALEAVIERAMHVDAARRFPSVTAFARALSPFASPHVQALWSPVLQLPSPDFAAPAPVSSLVPVTPTPPRVDASSPTGTHPSPVGSWLARSPSRAVLIGGAASVLCLAVGVAIGASSHGDPTEPAAPRAQPAPVALAAAPQVAVAAPPVQAPAPAPLAPPPSAPHAPVVQQLRLDPSPDVLVPSVDGGYVPRYSSPQYLDRNRAPPVVEAPPEAPHREGHHDSHR